MLDDTVLMSQNGISLLENTFPEFLLNDSSGDNFFKTNPSRWESAFSDGQLRHLEPLSVESPNDALIAFRSSNLLENTNSWVSQGQFGDSNGQEDVTLTIKDADDNIAETFSLTGDGYGEVFKDDQYETNGGEMTFDGPTIIKSSTGELSFDTTVSADGSRGGDITFQDTLDGYSANTQSLTFKAG